MDITLGGAALAGLLSFLSPCILPMVPFYLAYMAGISVGELRAGAAPEPAIRRRMVGAAIAFSLGVTVIFMLIGLGATAIGRLFVEWRRPLSLAAAALLLVMGLHMMGVLRIPVLNRQLRPAETAARPAPGIPAAFLTGLAFGFGWTPCVGPALTAIILIASGTGDLARGASLLLVFGLAMTLPFVLVALFAQPLLAWAGRHRRHLRHVERVTGALLVVFAAVIATNGVNRIADWMIRNFDWSATII